jgi:predicted extracellular nuclease
MSSNAKVKIVLRDLLLLFILVAFMALPIAIAEEVPAHVVISEVFYDESGTDNNEFCELYNPSDSDIDIGNWKLKAFNQSGILKTTTTLPVGTTITAHKFYLIGEKDPLNSSDWGGTAISPDCLRGGIDWQNGPDDYLVLEDSTGTYVDGVRWGHSTRVLVITHLLYRMSRTIILRQMS